MDSGAQRAVPASGLARRDRGKPTVLERRVQIDAVTAESGPAASVLVDARPPGPDPRIGPSRREEPQAARGGAEGAGWGALPERRRDEAPGIVDAGDGRSAGRGLGPGPVQALPVRRGAAADPRLILLREPDSPRAAAFRMLRHRLQRLDHGGDGTRVLALCAPRAGQGTTTAAVNVALALAERGRARVCLVEGNLRRPALAALFGFEPPMCLAERLALQRERPDLPWQVAELTPELHVLAARAGAAGRPLLDGPAFGAAIAALRRGGYRDVVIDGPELLGIADMNLVEERADRVLVVGRGGVTTGGDLRRTAAQLSGRKLLGLLLLDSD